MCVRACSCMEERKSAFGMTVLIFVLIYAPGCLSIRASPLRVPLLTCPHKEVLCWSSPRRGGADKPLNVCIVLANELEQNGREYRRVGRETERERGERGLLPLCAPLILLMVLKGLAGKQMLFCEMDSIFFPPSRLDSLQAARGIKFSSNMRMAGGGHQFGFNLKPKTQTFGSI